MAGRVFKNAYSTTNATDPSLTSIYTGKYPRHAGLVNHGVRIKPHEIHSLNYSIFLQEILLAYGYVTIAIDTLHRWHRRGFKYYIDPTQVHIKGGKSVLKKIIHRSIKLENLWLKIVPFLSSKRGLFSKPTAKHVTELALYMLKRQANYKKPFFLLIHYWDTHTPYIPPQTIVDRLYENNNENFSIAFLCFAIFCGIVFYLAEIVFRLSEIRRRSNCLQKKHPENNFGHI